MRLRYFTPRPDLRACLGDYYLFEADAPIRQAVMAELGNLRFVLSGTCTLEWADGARTALAGAAAFGPTTRAFSFEAGAGARIFGIGVVPIGWHAMFGFSAELLTDKTEDLQAIVGSAAAGVLERMRNAASDSELVAAADDFMAQSLAERCGRAREFPDAIERWLLDPNAPGVDDLSARMDVSRRQLDRLAKYYFGDSPKALQRKYRALHSAARLCLGGSKNWLDASGEAYYDQSHFIKEFRTFLGTTPREFLGAPGALLVESVRLRARATHRPALD